MNVYLVNVGRHIHGLAVEHRNVLTLRTLLGLGLWQSSEPVFGALIQAAVGRRWQLLLLDRSHLKHFLATGLQARRRMLRAVLHRR